MMMRLMPSSLWDASAVTEIEARANRLGLLHLPKAKGFFPGNTGTFHGFLPSPSALWCWRYVVLRSETGAMRAARMVLMAPGRGSAGGVFRNQFCVLAAWWPAALFGYAGTPTRLGR